MNWAELLPIVVLVIVFWLLVWRPSRKRQQQMAQTQSALVPGARVMLASGIFGEVASVGDEAIEVVIAPQVVVSVHRQAIGRVLSEPATPATDESGDAL